MGKKLLLEKRRKILRQNMKVINLRFANIFFISVKGYKHNRKKKHVGLRFEQTKSKII